MKVLVFVSFLLGFSILNSNLVWADENHNEVSNQEQNNNAENHDKSSEHHEDSTNHEQQVISDESEEDGSHSDMKEDVHQDTSSHEKADNEKGLHEEETEDGGHGNIEYVEKPANVKVLGIFGAINLSFILFGIWNKWLRRQEA